MTIVIYIDLQHSLIEVLLRASPELGTEDTKMNKTETCAEGGHSPVKETDL